ncbi:phosphatase PAP2 family protein [Streptomyces sp. PTM05]|uniref:Phosphatase PAP2 family protein n=1 Tax=Streptantibioticus parmotrematis TaxID=2873249 RepID=A0ABS7QTE7_9ACTN|nr:phosphatase PAP2 family protein [Streptantibioticus parmotrematis]MBY8886460.1 phosphatase PAP2 family protein [Streptantibioticus parmotrematis]
MSSTAARARGASRSRPRWWAELPLIAVVYAAYSAGRLLVAGDTSSAVRHARAILHAERLLHIDPEHLLNSVFTHTAWLGVPACFAYATLHYVITPGVLIWLWRRHSGHYLFMRTWLMISTLIGLIGFTLFPTAPPRLLPAGSGFHDTLAQYASFGWWGADASAPQGMGGLTNQYAAMPSLHVGWALWCGIMLWRYARNPLVRALGVAYPVVITLVVLGTANHYLLDTLAGVLVMGIGLLLTRPVRWLVARVLAALAGAATGATAAGSAATGAGAVETAGAAGASETAGAGAVETAGGRRAVEVAGSGAAARTGLPLPAQRHSTETIRPVRR